jgi:hypothetical protein
MGSLLDAPMEHHQALSFASPSLATIRCDTILMYVAGRHCTVGDANKAALRSVAHASPVRDSRWDARVCDAPQCRRYYLKHFQTFRFENERIYGYRLGLGLIANPTYPGRWRQQLAQHALETRYAWSHISNKNRIGRIRD